MLKLNRRISYLHEHTPPLTVQQLFEHGETWGPANLSVLLAYVYRPMLKDLYRYNSKTPVFPSSHQYDLRTPKGWGLSKSRKGETRFVHVTLFETTRGTLWQWRNCDESLWPLGGRGEHVRYQDVRGRPLSKWFCPLKAETSSIATSLRFSRCYFNFFAFVFLNFTQHSLFPGGASREGPIGRRDHSLRGRHGQYPGLRGEGICLLLFSFLWNSVISPLCAWLCILSSCDASFSSLQYIAERLELVSSWQKVLLPAVCTRTRTRTNTANGNFIFARRMASWDRNCQKMVVLHENRQDHFLGTQKVLSIHS